jgi:hypothetical protein
MQASVRSELISSTPVQRRAAVFYALAVIAMVAVIAAAADVMRAAAAAIPDSPDTRLPTHYSVGVSMPFPVIMDHDGGWTFLAIFFAFVALLAIASVVASTSLGRVGKPAIALLVVGSIAVLIAMTFFPVTFSVDSYAYVAFGRLLGVHGLNPYVERLASGSSLGDPVLAQLTSFLGTPLPDENYGPLWTWLSAGLAIVSQPGGLALAVWMQRAAGAVALIAAALGVLHMQRALEPQERARRTAMFALHPLALYESAAAGHNDMLMIAPAVWAFALVDGSPFVAGVLLGASISIKYVALIALPFLAIRAYRDRGVRAAFRVIGPALVVPIVLFIPLWPGWSGATTLMDLRSTLIVSPQWLAGIWLSSVSARVISIAFAAAFAIVFVYSIVRYVREGSVRLVFASITALLWSSPLLNPWYVQWLLPAAATAGRWARYAWWFGLLVTVRYVEDALRFPTTQAALSQRILLLEFVTIAIVAAPIIAAMLEERSAAEGPIE